MVIMVKKAELGQLIAVLINLQQVILAQWQSESIASGQLVAILMNKIIRSLCSTLRQFDLLKQFNAY